jgi:VWFA-related protein
MKIAAVLLIASSSVLLAQQPATETTFSLRQDVRNVVVDVLVSDKHGNPVTNLDRGTFQILENGVPQQIVFFDHHTAGESPAAPATGTAAAAPVLPADTHTNAMPAMPAGPQLVLLLDALNTPGPQQSYVRAQALEYLKKIPANTKIAIFVFGNELRQIQGFTSDPAILKAALDGRYYPTFAAGVNDGLVSASPVSDPLSSSTTSAAYSGTGYNASSIHASLEKFGNEGGLGQELRGRYTLDALSALSIYLGGIPGRKSLIWFTSSIPWSINPDFSMVYATTGRSDYTAEMKRLASQMTTGRISIFPVDANALASPTGYEASTGGSISGTSNIGPGSLNPNQASNGGAFAANLMTEQMDIAGAHQSMHNLAEATGGRAYYNTNGLAEAIEHVDNLNQDFYTLAYSPSDKRTDEGFRRIEVRLTNPALKLDYRRGYYAEDPDKAAQHNQLVLSNPLRVLMQHGAPDSMQILFRIRDTVAKTQPDPARPETRMGTQAAMLTGILIRYEFHWNVDLSAVAFHNAAGQHQGQLDATITAFDAQGKALNSIHSTLPLNLNDELFGRFRSSGLPMKQALDLPTGIVSIRVAVVDQVSGRTGATEFPMLVAQQKQ